MKMLPSSKKGLMDLSDLVWKSETCDLPGHAHTFMVVPESVFIMSCSQPFQKVGSRWGSMSPMCRWHLCGMVCSSGFQERGGGIPITGKDSLTLERREDAVGDCVSGGSSCLQECPGHSSAGRWHVASG